MPPPQDSPGVDSPDDRHAAGPVARHLWRAAGLVLLAVGFVGIFLPLLPTTIFWILAAVCFTRGDPRLRDWIFSHPRFGAGVRTFVTQGAMTRRGKMWAVAGLGSGCVLSVALTAAPGLRVALLAVFLLVAIYIVTRPEVPTSAP